MGHFPATGTATAGCQPTVREARIRFLAANELPACGGPSERWWGCDFGPVKLHFYNFAWRKRAIAHHDLHHLLTEYPCTLAGEVQLAAWEFAAGRYPHVGATAFCLPLVLAGVVFLPKRTLGAFLRGRRSTSLYGRPVDAALLDMSLADLREAVLPRQKARASFGDWLSFSALLSQACAVALSPAIAAILIYWLAVP